MRASSVKHAEYDILRFMLTQEHPDYHSASLHTMFSALGASVNDRGRLLPVNQAKDRVVQKRVRTAMKNIGEILAGMLSKRYSHLPEENKETYHFDEGVTEDDFKEFHERWLL